MTYLPRQPKIHCLGPADERLASHYRTANTIAVTMAVTLSVLLFWLEFNLRRQLRLARIGETAEGQVLDKRRNEGRNRTTYSVRYLFDAPDGQRSGWQTVGGVLWGCLQIGTAITVLYDPDHPDQHRPSFGFHLVQFLAEPDEEA